MRDVDETVLAGDLVGPALDSRPLDLDRTAAGAADEVMVVARTALAVEDLAAVVAQRIDLGGVGKGLEAAVNRGEADGFAAVLEHVVDFLRTRETVEVLEDGDDCTPLPCVAGCFDHDDS